MKEKMPLEDLIEMGNIIKDALDSIMKARLLARSPIPKKKGDYLDNSINWLDKFRNEADDILFEYYGKDPWVDKNGSKIFYGTCRVDPLTRSIEEEV